MADAVRIEGPAHVRGEWICDGRWHVGPERCGQPLDDARSRRWQLTHHTPQSLDLFAGMRSREHAPYDASREGRVTPPARASHRATRTGPEIGDARRHRAEPYDRRLGRLRSAQALPHYGIDVASASELAHRAFGGAH